MLSLRSCVGGGVAARTCNTHTHTHTRKKHARAHSLRARGRSETSAPAADWLMRCFSVMLAQFWHSEPSGVKPPTASIRFNHCHVPIKLIRGCRERCELGEEAELESVSRKAKTNVVV